MIAELRTPLPLITPKGPAICHYIIDYGIEHKFNICLRCFGSFLRDNNISCPFCGYKSFMPEGK